MSLRLLGFLVAFGFLTAGVPKAMTWLDFDLQTSGALSWLYPGFFNQGRDALLAPLAVGIESPLLWEAADVAVVLFEVSGIAALASRRTWRTWLAAACLFHLGNALILNIPFYIHAVVYLAFVPWSTLLPARVGVRGLGWRWSWLVLPFAVAAVLHLRGGGGGLLLGTTGLSKAGDAWLAVVCGLWLATLGTLLAGFARAGPSGPAEAPGTEVRGAA